MPTALTVSTSPVSSALGLTIDISGELRDFYGGELQNQSVIYYYASPGVDWIPIVSTQTDQNGAYRIEWISSATGAYWIMVDFEGYFPESNALPLYFRSDSNVTLNILNSENKYLFSIESNSTVSELHFDSAKLELSFNTTGPEGSRGYANVLMIKDSQGTNYDLKGYIDGEQLDHAPISSDRYLKIDFSYTQSTHRILVALYPTATSILDTMLGKAFILLAVSTIAITVIILVIFIRRSKLRFNKPPKNAN